MAEGRPRRLPEIPSPRERLAALAKSTPTLNVQHFSHSQRPMIVRLDLGLSLTPAGAVPRHSKTIPDLVA